MHQSIPEPAAPASAGRGRNNLLGLDYRAAANTLRTTEQPIIDIHLHVVGGEAAKIYRQVASAYGIGLSYSQTPLPDVEPVRQVLQERVRFLAVPTWSSPDRAHAFRQGLIDNLEIFRTRYDARIMKIWNAPRLREFFPGDSGADLVTIDAPWRVKAAEAATSLGMMFMVHVADPDTWFATKYSNAAIYGAKRDHYEGLERMLDRFPVPWIGAHMGGWPEDLVFLDGLLRRHPNLYLDTSATKWMVRELSRHPREQFVAFMARWKGRILFGSDIVTSDDHVRPAKVNPAHPKADQASSPNEAFDLYASRYWALRTMLETSYQGLSPVADDDLQMVEPEKYGPLSSPPLQGFGLASDLLDTIYWRAARDLLESWEQGTWRPLPTPAH